MRIFHDFLERIKDWLNNAYKYDNGLHGASWFD
jgi:hypothetical protein